MSSMLVRAVSRPLSRIISLRVNQLSCAPFVVSKRRLLSTTPKKKDAITIDLTKEEKGKLFEWKDIIKQHGVEEDYEEWESYGLHDTNKYSDAFDWHIACFGFMLAFAWGYFHLMLMPQFCSYDRNWCKREAMLELDRRRREGLPAISIDYIDPERVMATLPSDEELGDFEIVI